LPSPVQVATTDPVFAQVGNDEPIAGRINDNPARQSPSFQRLSAAGLLTLLAWAPNASQLGDIVVTARSVKPTFRRPVTAD
jgi:hypothetical protein